jgi:zinc transporter ZupT
LFLPFFAGGFLYLGSSDLLPQAHEKSDPLVSIAFTLLGVSADFRDYKIIGSLE